MSRWQLPDSMATYATYELSEALFTLTPDQRHAIARIVEHHYIESKPLTALFVGDQKICSEETYYRKGRSDPETGQVKRVGWSHQPAFVEALKMAAGLALRTRQVEETNAVREAVRRARLAAAPVISKLAQIAIGKGETKTVTPDGQIIISGNPIEDRDRIAAGKYLVDVALKNTEFGDRPSDGDLADDWWKAAEGDQ